VACSYNGLIGVRGPVDPQRKSWSREALALWFVCLVSAKHATRVLSTSHAWVLVVIPRCHPAFESQDIGAHVAAACGLRVEDVRLCGCGGDARVHVLTTVLLARHVRCCGAGAPVSAGGRVQSPVGGQCGACCECMDGCLCLRCVAGGTQCGLMSNFSHGCASPVLQTWCKADTDERHISAQPWHCADGDKVILTVRVAHACNIASCQARELNVICVRLQDFSVPLLKLSDDERALRAVRYPSCCALSFLPRCCLLLLLLLLCCVGWGTSDRYACCFLVPRLCVVVSQPKRSTGRAWARTRPSSRDTSRGVTIKTKCVLRADRAPFRLPMCLPEISCVRDHHHHLCRCTSRLRVCSLSTGSNGMLRHRPSDRRGLTQGCRRKRKRSHVPRCPRWHLCRVTRTTRVAARAFVVWRACARSTSWLKNDCWPATLLQRWVKTWTMKNRILIL